MTWWNRYRVGGRQSRRRSRRASRNTRTRAACVAQKIERRARRALYWYSYLRPVCAPARSRGSTWPSRAPGLTIRGRNPGWRKAQPEPLTTDDPSARTPLPESGPATALLRTRTTCHQARRCASPFKSAEPNGSPRFILDNPLPKMEASFGAGRQLGQIAVSDRGTLGGLTQFLTQFGFRAQPLARKLLILQVRRDVRVVEGARLESVCRGNSTVGSNPSLSANLRSLARL